MADERPARPRAALVSCADDVRIWHCPAPSGTGRDAVGPLVPSLSFVPHAGFGTACVRWNAAGDRVVRRFPHAPARARAVLRRPPSRRGRVERALNGAHA